MTCLLRHDRAEVWCADSLDPEAVAGIMGGRLADAAIFDGPFSAKTHDGHKAGKVTADRAAGFASEATPESRYALKVTSGAKERADLEYAAWSETDVARFCGIWSPHVRGWWVSITDHVLGRAWETEMGATGLYVFPPLPLVETGSRVRMLGDGPSNWSCFVYVARPRTEPWSSWGTTRGFYVQPAERRINAKHGTDRITGGKPAKSMVEMVADYTRPESPLRPGDPSLVVDPTSGGGTTLLAALRLGRRVIGIEKDSGRAQLCAERVSAELENSERWARQVGQGALFGGRNA